jgi:RNA polymerase sigma factor (TIGR02999 family)
LLRLWRSGDAQAFDTLMPLVYDELRRMARRHLAHERKSHTLQPTAIVHEAYLRLIQEEGRDWQNRAHFFAAAAAAMRRILVDYARRRATKKRGGDDSPYQLESGIAEPKTVDVIAVDDALHKLAELDPEQARVVELRFFAGLTEEEAAAALDISPATARRRWQGARTWLHRELAAGRR